METSRNQITLGELPVGVRLLLQTKRDWRIAVVSRISEEKERVTLMVCSPTGRTYRKSCAIETPVNFDGAIPFLGEGVWRDTLAKYDFRW